MLFVSCFRKAIWHSRGCAVFYDSFCLMSQYILYQLYWRKESVRKRAKEPESPKTGKIYSDKMSINVLNLRCIDKATEEDKAWKLDYWARLFKSMTWEEIRMMAQDKKYMAEEIARLQELLKQNSQNNQKVSVSIYYF